MDPHTKRVGLIFAHPDDETFGVAASCQAWSDEGIQKVLLMATPGDAGRAGLPSNMDQVSSYDLGQIRRNELAIVAQILSIQSVIHLDYPDGGLTKIPLEELQLHVEQFLNHYNPQVVVSFPANGVTGHSDHITIAAAVQLAVHGKKCQKVKRYFSVRLGPQKDCETVPYAVDSSKHWPVKSEALKTHVSQKHTVEKVFGDLSKAPPEYRWELFNLEWSADGVHPKQLTSLFEGIE